MSLLLAKKKKKKIAVFLCTGDTCRGPMAQGYMLRAMEERGITGIEVKTAGIMTSHGLIPTPEAVQVMKNAGVDITAHRSASLTEALIRKADLILGMSPLQTQFAKRLSEEAVGKTHLLKEYAESDLKNYQINDPMGATLEVYKRVYREMKLAIDKMLDTKDFFKPAPKEADKSAAAPKKAAEAAPAPAAAKPAPRAKAKTTKPKAAAPKGAKATKAKAAKSTSSKKKAAAS